jgi:hypothetical protein
MISRLLTTCLLVALAACDSSAKPGDTTKGVSSKSTETSAVASAEATPPAKGSSKAPSYPEVRQARHTAKGRVVAIGDLHGDLGATREVLQLAGALGDGDRWVGGDLTVVQTGDQLDRGNEEAEILELLSRLTTEAKAAGGAMIVLNGNHELMNAQIDFRYVTPEAIDDFSGKSKPTLPRELQGRVPERFAGRAAAFWPGGEVARLLAQRPVIAIVGESVFAHGGVLDSHARYGIDRINSEISAWLQGYRPMPKIVAGQDSPVWTRLYSNPSPPAAACKQLHRVLEGLGAKRMVVGHTIQKSGITSACNDEVWRIDVGMSSHYGGCCVSALEITDQGTKVLVKQKGEKAEHVGVSPPPAP